MANYPVPYMNNYGYSGVGQQMYPQYQQQGMSMGNPQMQQVSQAMMNEHGLKWVDGEVGAKAYQMPAGWPANTPIALWDSNDTVIYLKSINPMGMPNPLQKAHYTLEGMKSGDRNVGVSGNAGETEKQVMPDMTQYVRKDDLERLKQDLMDTIGSMNTSGTGVRRNNSKGENA